MLDLEGKMYEARLAMTTSEKGRAGSSGSAIWNLVLTLTVMLLGGRELSGAATVELNNAFYLMSLSKLRDQASFATNTLQTRASFLAFQKLAWEAAEDPVLGDEVRLLVISGAAGACQKYLLSIPGTSLELRGFTESEGSNVLSFLSFALRIFDQTPKPRGGTRNVAPPWGYQGPSAAGMAPEGITDPECRTDYEASIAENRKSIGRHRVWEDLKSSISRCFWYLKNMVRHAPEPGASEQLINLIKVSQLAERMKAPLLSSDPRDDKWMP
jgi:hypothetical protein